MPYSSIATFVHVEMQRMLPANVTVLEHSGIPEPREETKKAVWRAPQLAVLFFSTRELTNEGVSLLATTGNGDRNVVVTVLLVLVLREEQVRVRVLDHEENLHEDAHHGEVELNRTRLSHCPPDLRPRNKDFEAVQR